MNDPSKRINVNLSSLLGLKAELLRKHEEVKKIKHNDPINTFVPKQRASSNRSGVSKEKHTKRKIGSQENSIFDEEETSKLEYSKQVLEAKAKFYDRMTKSDSLNFDPNSLVAFNRKIHMPAIYSIDTQNVESTIRDENELFSQNDECDENDWVEFADCLGRTRKCLHKDLEFYKQKDIELAEIQDKKTFTSDISSVISVDSAKLTCLENETNKNWKENSEMSATLEEMRRNWQQQEETNKNREYVHYQDILFDEAREHGVGYYGFSTDTTERDKQQKELEKIRLQTIQKQEQTDRIRTMRDKTLAVRVRAAKQRQRARLGLPAIETVEKLIDNGEQNNIEAETSKCDDIKLHQKVSKQNKSRENHIRPWDIGKIENKMTEHDSVAKEWLYKPEKSLLTQEQWNERKRSERIQEFSPIAALSTHVPHFKYDHTSLNSSQYNTIYPNSINKINSYGSFDNKQGDVHEAMLPNKHDALENSIEAGLKFLREKSDKNTKSTKSKWSANANY